jgi:hypothetical protein
LSVHLGGLDWNTKTKIELDQAKVFPFKLIIAQDIDLINVVNESKVGCYVVNKLEIF